MSATTFKVDYLARLQVDRLPLSEKKALARLFGDRNIENQDDTRRTSDGQFVSRLGTRRVLWRRSDSGMPEILSIVDRSYAA